MENRVEILREFIDDILLNMTDVENRRIAYLHLYGVSQACALIALRRGENVELATMAGMLHDLHTFKQGDHDNHAEKGAVLAREILNKLQLTNLIETDMICSAIHNHSSKGSTHSAFDEVLIDADVLQHCIYNITLPIMEHEKARFEKLIKEFGLRYIENMDLILQLNKFMLNIGVDYALCGGHAIDLFLGRKTRPHKDLDVVTYWEDRDKIVQYMLNQGWDVFEPCGNEYLHKISKVSDQIRNRSNIWCVKPSNQYYKFTEHEKDMYSVDFDKSEQTELDYIEFLFNTQNDGNFLYARNHDINLIYDKAILRIQDIPCLAPEMVLLYKSTAADDTDYQLDFDNASKEMNEGQLTWLKKSLSIMFPQGHKWLGR